MLQLLDFAGIYFRAFYAVPGSMRAPDGRPVNAIRGTLDIMRRVIEDGRPTRLIACLDVDWRPAWRVDLIPSYKTHRVAQLEGGLTGGAEAVPDELAGQVPTLLRVLDAIGLATAGAPGCEADDVIGTLAAAERLDPVEVVTGDRDLFQVAAVGPPPVVVRYIGAGMNKARVFTAADVAARHGIPLGTYADFAALRGDSSDGLPGVAGVGDKTAAALITSYGSVEAILAALDDPAATIAAGLGAKLRGARDYLEVAPAVVRVRTDGQVDLTPGAGRVPDSPVDLDGLVEITDELGIRGPVNRLLTALGMSAG